MGSKPSFQLKFIGAYVLQFFSPISDSLGSVLIIQLIIVKKVKILAKHLANVINLIFLSDDKVVKIFLEQTLSGSPL
jgi:hypothetical protein